jgi:HAD domain in Swiss Army Knife RNA repair proteins
VENPCKPLLLVDVDGVISLFGFPSSDRPAGTWLTVDGVPHLISAAAAEHLQALHADFELVWCTGWEEKANEYLPALLGLPAELPFLSFDANPGRGHAHWKLAAIEAYAGPERAVAWVDDALNDACHVWAAERAAPTLLLETLPEVGLEDRHVSMLKEWARQPAQPGQRR